MPLARVQGYLAIGSALIGAACTLLPHPEHFNVAGILIVAGILLALGAILFWRPERVSLLALRMGPAVATALITAMVIFSGDSTSGYALFYIWVGLYVFCFPISTREASGNVAFAALGYAVAIAITPAPPASGDHQALPHFVIVAGTLITAGVLLGYLRVKLERLTRRLTNASRTDLLTGLLNRAGMHEALDTELERARPELRPFSMLAIDVDRFTQFNEQLGSAAGDELLKRLAEILERSCRSIDTVARSFGEDFVVVLPDTDQRQAFIVAEDALFEIRRAFAELRPPLTASIGVASFPEHGETTEELLTSADRALRAAKTLGGDRPAIYSPHVTKTIGLAAGRRSVESQTHLAVALGLAEALDQHDSNTARHSQTVGRLCELMARELGFDEPRVQRLRLAGILHDIGKIGVPDMILGKPGPLTTEERAEMRRHPEIGARILCSNELDDIRAWIGAHHERPDGEGYPLGIDGSEIPIEASILAVGDAYEAMTSDRVYRIGIGEDRAREELLDNAGTQFEATVVGALIGLLERSGPVIA